MPHESKEMMNSLKPSKEQQSKRKSNEYWVKSAQSLGLIDVHQITVDDPQQPPLTSAEEDSAIPCGKKRKRVSISKMKKARGDAAPHIRFGAGCPGALVPQTNPSHAPSPLASGTDAAAEAAAYAAAEAAAATAAATPAAADAVITSAPAVPPPFDTAGSAVPSGVAAADSSGRSTAVSSDPVAPTSYPAGSAPVPALDAAEVLYGLAKKGDSNGKTPNGTPI